MLLLLNGGAALSILTFAGNTKTASPWLVLAIGAFALGAAAAPATMGCAYLTQLHYGNAQSQSSSSARAQASATWLHNVTYLLAAASLIFFLLGMGVAAIGLLPSTPPH